MIEYFIGSITAISNDNKFSASISISDNLSIRNNSAIYIGSKTKKPKVNDDVFVYCLSKCLFLYKVIDLEDDLVIKQDDSTYIDLSKSGEIDYIANINKIGSKTASLIPITDQDVLVFNGTIGGSPASGTITFTTPLKCTKVKVE